MAARWHKDSDRWIWRVYDGVELGSGAVTAKGGEDTTDIYIVPRKDGWWIVSAKTLMKGGKDWIEAVKNGEGIPIAGPFGHENDAKAAWRVMYG